MKACKDKYGAAFTAEHSSPPPAHREPNIHEYIILDKEDQITAMVRNSDSKTKIVLDKKTIRKIYCNGTEGGGIYQPK